MAIKKDGNAREFNLSLMDLHDILQALVWKPEVEVTTAQPNTYSLIDIK
jgi:hypothetical protein